MFSTQVECRDYLSAHKHIIIRKVTTTQESWCVVQGKVTAHFSTKKNNTLQDVTLEPGDMSMTFYGE